MMESTGLVAIGTKASLRGFLGDQMRMRTSTRLHWLFGRMGQRMNRKRAQQVYRVAGTVHTSPGMPRLAPSTLFLVGSGKLVAESRSPFHPIAGSGGALAVAPKS
jgi:hypothetical protein